MSSEVVRPVAGSSKHIFLSFLLGLGLAGFSYATLAAAQASESADFRPPKWLADLKVESERWFSTPSVHPPTATPSNERELPAERLVPNERIESTSLVADAPPASLSDLFGDSAVANASRFETQAINTTLPLAVGRLQGSYAVGQTGSASYSIPVWMPKGARGIQPNLAIVYSSGSPDSMLGPGWNLAGLSAISRCNRTVAQDGTPGAIELSYVDRFCLDGNQLRTTFGTYGYPGSTYQTEVDAFMRVTANGTTGNGPTYFIVEGKDGLYYEYGNTIDSRAFSSTSTTPYSWLLNKVRDRQGNNYRVTYASSNGSIHPVSIEYTQTPSLTSPFYTYPYKINFIYQARQSSLYRYVSGTQIQESEVLGAISVENFTGGTLRRYNFGYGTSPITQRDFLATIQECTSSTCLKATSITYQFGQAGFPQPALSTASGNTTVGSQNTGDFDGDGRQDLVFATGSVPSFQWRVQFATGSGYGAPVNTGAVTADTGKVLVDDLLGEGRVVLFAPVGASWNMYRWNGSSFSATVSSVPVDSAMLTAPYTTATADTDGDGRKDLLWVAQPPASTVKIMRRQNTSSGGVLSFATSAIAFSGRVQQIRGNNSFPGSDIRRLDFDGDGREDILVTLQEAPMGGGGIYTNTLVGRGDVLATNGVGLGGSQTTTSYLPAQWNDDRCTDLVKISTVQIANCGASGSSASITIPSTGGSGQFVVTDWDGDGRTDLLAPTPNSGSYYALFKSYGSAASNPISTSIAYGTGRWIMTDQDGDGKSDPAFANASAGHAITFANHYSPNVAPDLATQIARRVRDVRQLRLLLDLGGQCLLCTGQRGAGVSAAGADRAHIHGLFYDRLHRQRQQLHDHPLLLQRKHESRRSRLQRLRTPLFDRRSDRHREHGVVRTVVSSHGNDFLFAVAPVGLDDQNLRDHQQFRHAGRRFGLSSPFVSVREQLHKGRL